VVTASHADQLKLLDLAELDKQYQQLVHAKRTHPTLARIDQLDTQMADLQGTLTASRTAVTDNRRELSRVEADVEQVVTRATRDRERLESGAVGHKDAVAITEELASLSRRQEALEETQLEVMERLEAHQEALAQVEDGYSELADAKTATEAERDEAFADLATQARSVVDERKILVDQIAAPLVKQYDTIRTRLGSGVGALRAGCCTGCGIELNPRDLDTAKSATADQVVLCEECGRILVRDEERARDAEAIDHD
jgi:predicted  nucleic acid-binding Zn-ribbon protein